MVRRLAPKNLKALADVRLSTLVNAELSRARRRVSALKERYPSAEPRELAQRLIDEKKSVAGMVGGISGVFGAVTVPADLLVMVYLQVVLLVEVATLYDANVKTASAQRELLDLFGEANGLGPTARSSPKVLGQLAALLLKRGGLPLLGRAMPLVAAPISAYLNNKHIQTVGDEAVRHYQGFRATKAKSRKRKESEGHS